MDLIEIRCEGVDWSGLAYHRGMWQAVVKLWVPIKYGEFLDELNNC